MICNYPDSFVEGKPNTVELRHDWLRPPQVLEAAQLAARARGIVSSPAGFKAGLEWKSQGHRAD